MVFYRWARRVKSSFFSRKKTGMIFVLVMLGSIFGLAYAATEGTAGIGPPDAAPDIGEVHNQEIENTNVGPYETFPYYSENVIGGTGGMLSSGNVFFIEPRPQLYTGLWIELEMVNRKGVNEHWTSYTENFGLYLAITDNGQRYEWDNMWKLIDRGYLTLVGGPLTFKVSTNYSDNIYVSDYSEPGVGGVTSFENAQANDGDYENIYEENLSAPSDNYQLDNVSYEFADVPRNAKQTLEIEYRIDGDSENVWLYLYNYSTESWDFQDNLTSTSLDNYELTLTDENFEYRKLTGSTTENIRVLFRQPENDATQTSLMVDYARITGGTEMGSQHPMVVALDRGDFWAKEGFYEFPQIRHYLSIEESGY